MKGQLSFTRRSNRPRWAPKSVTKGDPEKYAKALKLCRNCSAELWEKIKDFSTIELEQFKDANPAQFKTDFPDGDEAFLAAQRLVHLASASRISMGISVDDHIRALSQAIQSMLEFNSLADPKVTSTVPIDQQIGRITDLLNLIRFADVTRPHADAISNAKQDNDIPMTFVNLDGSCFLIVVVQALFALRGISAHIKSIPNPRIRSALEGLMSLKNSGAPIASVTDLRDALGDQFQFCKGYSPMLALNAVFREIPSLKVLTLDQRTDLKQATSFIQKRSFLPINLFANLSAPKLVQEHANQDVIVIDREGTGCRDDAECPLVISVSQPGEAKLVKTFDLVATFFLEPGHVTASVSAKARNGATRWYDVNDSIAQAITDPYGTFPNESLKKKGWFGEYIQTYPIRPFSECTIALIYQRRVDSRELKHEAKTKPKYSNKAEKKAAKKARAHARKAAKLGE
jgi:hypothetical protein